jgi:hypothetical protein
MTQRTMCDIVFCAFVGFVMLGPAKGPAKAGHYVLTIVMTNLSAAERVWQTGTWRDSKVERPKVLFGAQPRDPNSTLPRTPAAREVRTYVIETETMRLELRQDATVDTPRIDVLIGLPVTFALEKKTVYVKDDEGKEHRLSVRKQTTLTPAQAK